MPKQPGVVALPINPKKQRDWTKDEEKALEQFEVEFKELSDRFNMHFVGVVVPKSIAREFVEAGLPRSFDDIGVLWLNGYEGWAYVAMEEVDHRIKNSDDPFNTEGGDE